MNITQNKHKSNQRATTLKQRNGKQPLLDGAHRLHLILTPIMLHEDIPNGY